MPGVNSTEVDADLVHSQSKCVKSAQYRHFQQIILSETILKDYLDGIVILTQQGTILYINKAAQSLLNRIQPEDSDRLPDELWWICQAFLEHTNDCQTETGVDETEFRFSLSMLLRIRVRWIVLDQLNSPCLMMTLIDQNQSAKNLAIAEAKKLNLTPSETKVYALYQTHYSYQEIANELGITINTVKKHMKSVHLKRRPTLEDNSSDLSHSNPI